MKIIQIPILFLLLILSACGGKFIGKSTETASTANIYPGQAEPGARIIFSNQNFTDLNDYITLPNTAYKCLGDVLRVYYVDGDDYMGSPTALPTPSASDDLLPTNRPIFISNVSVDITNTFYPTTVADTLSSDVCSYRTITSSPDPSSCADFDRMPAAIPAPTIDPTPVPVPAPVPSATPDTNEYFGSNYYRVRDDWCTSQGPTLSPDPELTKADVGGVSIDLDRSQLGAHEDLLMMVTYHALNENSGVDNWPVMKAIDKSTGAALAPGDRRAQTSVDRTVLKINLVATQQSLDTLLQVAQPRPWTYNRTLSYPIYIKEIATLEDPFGTLRTEQVYIPLSQNGLVDRIRIDRVRGSYHLFQVDLYRLGNRTE